jgi:branched-subunit amino acid transport protein AzlD
MNDNGYVIGVIAAMGLVTFALRALPFVAGQWLQKHPIVHNLGQFLPLAIMTLLLVNSTIAAMGEDPDSPLAELAAVLLVAIVQWFSKNALLSILLGTGIYVLLKNFV